MKKSKFNLSHPASFTAKMGLLVPFCVLPDCLPGDVYRLGVRSFIRVQPMLAPLMHQVNFFTQWWFVPNRILWNNWQDFITGGEDGTAAPQFPTIKITPTTSSLADYMGLPVNGKELEVSALPFRAYAEIWNTRYRDQDLQSELSISYDDGVDTTTNTELKRCSWAKDYFTTARPFTQRGAQISVPVIPGTISGSAYPVYNPQLRFSNVQTSAPSTKKLGTITLHNYHQTLQTGHSILITFNHSGKVASFSYNDAKISDTSGYFEVVCNRQVDGVSGWNPPAQVLCLAQYKFYIDCSITWGQPVSYSDTPISNVSGLSFKAYSTSYKNGENANVNCPTVQTAFKLKDVDVTGTVTLSEKVDLGSSGAVNIRDLRLASATQRYQERSMQWGNRYEEFIQREFKVRPKDARIQRPEYLGGAKTRLQISEVLQTAEGTDTGVGTMRGHGVGAMSSRRIKFMTPEHGVIIGLFSIRPHSITTQGVNRAWRKFTKFDYFTPEFANVGMQEVFQSEIYADGTNFDTVFGYANRYDEYRKIPARISGEFRNLLDYWNLARIFDAPPVLNSSFIEMNPSTRIFAEQTQDQFLCMLQNDVFAYRPIPKRAKNILM